MTEPTPDDYADLIVDMADEKNLPLVVLGGDELIADALLGLGARFLHARYLTYLVPALYVIATEDDRYASYVFPPRSVIVDLLRVVESEIPGVEVHHFTD